MNKNYIKIILLGDGRVGKTSILNRYINNTFCEKEEMTVNSCYFEKEMIINGEKFTFCLWDTAGQEKFNALTPIYYRDAKAAILVYDVTIPETFARVKKWVEELKAFNKNTILAIAGNKIDLIRQSDIDKKEALEYSQSEKATHMFTSAKTGEGLDEIFSIVCKEIANSQAQSKEVTTPKEKNKKIVISKTAGSSEKKKNCCKR